MKKTMLHSEFKKRYPHLLNRTEVIAKDGTVNIDIQFVHPDYCAWISEESSGFIVGINFLHSHFDFTKTDLEDREESLESAFEYLDEILNDNVIAIGEKGRENKYMISRCTDSESALEMKKSIELENYDFVSFNFTL